MENSYLNARREWNERYGDYIKSKNTWQRLCFATTGLSVVLGLSLAYVASKSSIQPYVVEVDKSGRISHPIPLDNFAKGNQKLIRAHLAEIIYSARTILSDQDAQIRLLHKIYASCSAPAKAFFDEYYERENILKLAKDISVSVEIESVLPASGNTWQVEWREKKREHTGSLVADEIWKALITIDLVPPRTLEHMMVNPVGVLIKEISWSKILN